MRNSTIAGTRRYLLSRRNAGTIVCRGFGLFEFVVVIILLSLLAVIAVPRMLTAVDETELAALETAAANFGVAVSIAHAQWAAAGYSKGLPTSAAKKRAVELEGRRFYANEYGWPANTGSELGAAANKQQPIECLQVFELLLQAPPPATLDRAEREGYRFFVSVEKNAGGRAGKRGDICRYTLILQSGDATEATHYFEYDLVDGQVTVVYPSQ